MSTFYAMPKIDLEALEAQLTAEEFGLVKGIVNTKTGELRVSKPSLPKKIQVPSGNTYGYTYEYKDAADAAKGMTAYVWRMVAFSISPVAQHQCMPCMAFCDLPGTASREERIALEKRMDTLADVVVKSVPVSQWHGVARWQKALGR